MNNTNYPKVLVIGAGGGHLTEAMLATDGIPMHRVIVTYKLPHTDKTLGDNRHHYVIDPHKSYWKYLVNALQSLWIILRERPEYIVNTGGGISIACSLLGKVFGTRLIYVESGARINTPSKTGRFLYKYSDLFIVQWRPLLAHYPNAVYGGPLL
jgi:UDP-N-acetylglucosamine:LPS N-acetylglucosamine transferase